MITWQDVIKCRSGGARLLSVYRCF